MPRLTKRVVDSTLSGQKPVLVADGEIRGFCLRVLPSGIKSFCLVYRNKYGRQRWLTIGRYGEMTPDQARDLAIVLRGRIALGEDPVDDKTATRDSISLDELLDRYEKDHLEVHNRAVTATENKRILRNHVRPALGARKVKDIGTADIAELVTRLRSKPRTANLARAILSKVFNLAELWGLRLRASNPCEGVPKYPEKAHDRTLTIAEQEAFGAALKAAEGEELPACLDAIRLLALSGCRLGEVMGLKRSQVDHAGMVLRLEVTKTKPRLHPLGNTAMALLKGVLASHDSEWVFPNPDGLAPLAKWRLEKCWQRVRAQAGLSDVRLHDLRHNVGSVSGKHAANAFLVRDKLGHSTTSMTGRYVHPDASPLTALSNAVELEIGGAMGLGKVVSFKKAKGKA